MRFGRPPRALRRPGARPNNLALMPASLLPFKDEWQAMANHLPEGGVLVILPPTNTPSRKILNKVAAMLGVKGRPVTTLAAERFG